ncbi:5'-nucleotidase C-terminal domain-containing protein [Ahrensia marina]|uniref:5'-nucleotidase n=1 Tax=Ahrensia marina TaxID=1514904 RepID=A0A0N0VL22_9HYPH|nr:5'-nucleotidase C-terminal domain-containing protein [Ahrensia marina]KPB00318.1 5'-nucleotidase [Ahrensia marina]
MKKIAALAAMSVSALALSTSFAAADYELNILHINDLHSRIESINKYDSTCGAEDEAEGKCFGGVARVQTKIDERRDALTGEDKNVLLLDAGDQFQGSLFYITYKGDAAAEFMNGMGFDAMAVGNHEFDDGPEGLKKFLGNVDFPVISGNTIAGASTGIEGGLTPYIVKEVGGEKVGILSVLATDTDETSSPGKDVLFLDEVGYLKGAVAELEEQGVNKIILLSHVGLPRDKEIAAAVDGIDVIVGGHSHTLLSNTDENAVDTYPVNVKNPSGKDVPIVQAYAYSKYLGELKVVFDDEGNVTSASGDPHLLDASVEPNADVLARVKELGGPIEELKAQVIGETTEMIEGSRDVCRAGECAMGTLVADAMLDRTKDQGVVFAITNGGGLRSSIDAGEVTMGEALSVLPFQNTLATFETTGADILEALENGVGQIEEGAGRFPQVAGMKFTFDKDAEPGSRISDVMVADREGNFSPLDPDATYLAATNNYVRNGGDGYSMFVDAAKAYDFGPGLEQVLADYLAENNPYTPYTDGRISAAASMEKAEMEKPEDEAAAEPEMKAEAETEAEVMVPETKLGAGDLASSGPAIETEAASEAEAPAAEAEATAEAEVMVPETKLGAGDLASSGPQIEAAAPEAEMAEGEAMEKEAPEAEMAEGETMEKEASAEAEMAEEDMKKEEMAEETMEMKTHTIVAGDTLWDLAAEFYGNGQMFTKLQEANPELNAGDLKIGATINVPK